MRLWFPKSDTKVAGADAMSSDWYKAFVSWFNASPVNTGAISSDTTIQASGRYTVDTTSGNVTVTVKAFPVTLVKTVAANSVVIGGLTVNGASPFSWSTQWQAYTIDVIDGVGVAY